jgi:long-chain acyl-CoA synthetase
LTLDWLEERLRGAGESPAIVWEDRSYSYSWLSDELEKRSEELEAHGIAPGSVVAVAGDYSPHTCVLLLALIDRSCVVIPQGAEANADSERLLDIAQVQHVVRFSPEEGCQYRDRHVRVDHPLLRTLISAGDPGLVLFTSGSTGEPKGALHSLPRLLEKYKTRRSSLRTLTFLLLDHIGGINTLFHILSNTGTIITARERTPDAIGAAIERHRVELLPTTPTFLNLLLLSGAIGRYDLSSLRQITYGTEPMPEATLARLHALLPDVRLSQTYGLSELGILRARSRSSDSLWVELGGPGVETKIVNGILWIRTPSAMLGYLNAPSPFDAEGWFNTEDEVVADGEFLRILGRRSEIINVGGQKVYPAEIESVLLQLPNVRDVLVGGVRNPITGQMVAAYFNLCEPEDRESLRRRVREHCRALLPSFKIPSRVEIVTEEQYSDRFKKKRSPLAGN